MRKTIFLFVCVFLIPVAGHSAVQTTAIPYTHDGVQLEGYLAWDDAIKGKRPGVLIVHEWWDLNDYARNRAEQLAQMGYVAFAVDMYGKGSVTTHPDQAGTWMREIQSNVKTWQQRAIEGLRILQKQELVDTSRLAAIGYCFGGATVMQLVYSGIDIQGVVSFHGSLPLPRMQRVPQPKTKILIAHGNADPFLSENHVKKFRSALDKAGFDWQMVIYAGARHSFTNPHAGTFGMDALKYDKNADQRSWKQMQVFFDEIFQ